MNSWISSTLKLLILQPTFIKIFFHKFRQVLPTLQVTNLLFLFTLYMDICRKFKAQHSLQNIDTEASIFLITFPKIIYTNPTVHYVRVRNDKLIFKPSTGRHQLEINYDRISLEINYFSPNETAPDDSTRAIKILYVRNLHKCAPVDVYSIQSFLKGEETSAWIIFYVDEER